MPIAGMWSTAPNHALEIVGILPPRKVMYPVQTAIDRWVFAE